MKLPEEYWRRVEREPLSAGMSGSELVRALRADTTEVVQAITASGTQRLFVWRGQADSDYGLSSSLFRAALGMCSQAELTERVLSALEEEVISYARCVGLGRGMTNLQLLHALQHYRLPTRLIDVSRDPVAAVWFACNQKARKDGRLFLFLVPEQSVRQDDNNLQMLPWKGIRLGEWTNRVLFLEASASNPRMAAQYGSFLVGGLARNYAGQQRLTRDARGIWRSVPADQIHEISEIFVKFPQQVTPRRVLRWAPHETYGITWRIPSAAKGPLLRALQKLGVNESSMYPDFEGALRGMREALRLS